MIYTFRATAPPLRGSMVRVPRTVPLFPLTLLLVFSTVITSAYAERVAGQVYQLASAQEVTRSSGAPWLKLAANGPIAFEVEPRTETDGGNTLVIRLHGVTPGEATLFSALQVFAVTAQATGDGGTRLTLRVADTSALLRVRPGDRSSELHVVLEAP